ncbi:MAG: DHH family phosphoesterase [Planctomycetota bacterium]|jgi:phosphoesterase RecJ-like protein
MIKESVLQKAVELIEKSDDVLVATHIRPDGDACGCMIAMAKAIEALGKKVRLLTLSPIPRWYEFLFEEKVPLLGEDVTLEQLMDGQFDDFDLIILLDVNSDNQLPGFCEYLKKKEKKVVAIDHHITGDDHGDVELLDTSAAATGLIVYELFRYAKWPITDKIAKSLFVATATDTGWFQFNNTDSRVHRVCADLIDAGVDVTEVYHQLYQNYSTERFNLMLRLLNSLELHCDGRLAIQHLTQADFDESGASYSDTENLIDECRKIGSVEAATLLVETSDGKVRCSLRSLGSVDVLKVASAFGGGGHKMAAGAHLEMTLEQAKEAVKAEIQKQLQ